MNTLVHFLCLLVSLFGMHSPPYLHDKYSYTLFHLMYRLFPYEAFLTINLYPEMTSIPTS